MTIFEDLQPGEVVYTASVKPPRYVREERLKRKLKDLTTNPPRATEKNSAYWMACFAARSFARWLAVKTGKSPFYGKSDKQAA